MDYKNFFDDLDEEIASVLAEIESEPEPESNPKPKFEPKFVKPSAVKSGNAGFEDVRSSSDFEDISSGVITTDEQESSEAEEINEEPEESETELSEAEGSETETVSEPETTEDVATGSVQGEFEDISSSSGSEESDSEVISDADEIEALLKELENTGSEESGEKAEEGKEEKAKDGSNPSVEENKSAPAGHAHASDERRVIHTSTVRRRCLPETEKPKRQKPQKLMTPKAWFAAFPGFSVAKKTALTSVTAFCLLVFIIILVFAIHPKKETSEQENRSLAQFPKLTISSLTSGTFMDDFESYLSDQFPLRNTLLSLKTAGDLVLGKECINGVYVGKDGYLLEAPAEYNEGDVKEMTDAVNSFTKSNKNLKTSVAIVPDAYQILQDKLPTFLELPDESGQLKNISSALEGVNWIDTESPISKLQKKEQVYYRTDHHWTTRAAYAVFEQIADSWGIDSSETEYKFYTVSTTFQGTLSSSTGINKSTDEIEICAPEGVKYYVDYESQNEKKATVFDESKLNQKNQYEVFMGGNFDKVIITTNVDTTDTLLLFKDSYANCMIPMLLPYFSKIVVVDPRYYSGSVNDLTDEYTFTHSLFLFSLNTVLSSKSIAKVLTAD